MYSEVLLDQWHLYDSPFVPYLTTHLLVASLSSSCWVASDSCTENRHKDGICQKDFRLVSGFMVFKRRKSVQYFCYWKNGNADLLYLLTLFSTWISTWEFTVRDLLHLVYKLKGLLETRTCALHAPGSVWCQACFLDKAHGTCFLRG